MDQVKIRTSLPPEMKKVTISGGKKQEVEVDLDSLLTRIAMRIIFLEDQLDGILAAPLAEEEKPEKKRKGRH